MPARPASRVLRWLAALTTVMVLGGCALPRMIDSEVQSFVGTPPAAAGASYRFERLPSQQALATTQDEIEALAEPALERAGLVRSDTQARYSVQVEIRVSQYPNPSARQPRWSGAIMTGNGMLWYPAVQVVLEPPWYRHTVRLLMRHLPSAQVAYESTASFDGPWSDSANLLPVILEAALRDFPNPPAGQRKVVIELPSGNTRER